jgi:hypothetical protein
MPIMVGKRMSERTMELNNSVCYSLALALDVGLSLSLSLSLSPFAGSLRREKKESVEEKTDKSNDDEKIMT